MKMLSTPLFSFLSLVGLVALGSPEFVRAEPAGPAAGAVTESKTIAPEGVVEARPVVIFVRGAAGSGEYAPRFAAQEEAWKKAAERAGAEWRPVPVPAAAGESAVAAPGSGTTASGATSHDLLHKILTDLSPAGPAAVWMVLAGHGTWDGKEARFNLEGPDLSAGELAEWLKPVSRPLVVVNTSAASSAFVNVLSGPGRVIISATRSGNEKNYARFGEELAASLDDPAADYDEDGQVTLLELFLRASSRVREFYLAEGRIQTEHALVDDNGDGKGTPASFFRGLRANQTAKNGAVPDGAKSRLTSLIPDAASQKLSPSQLQQRDALEGEVETLRAAKAGMMEEEYYLKLEGILRRLAAIQPEVEAGRKPEPEPEPEQKLEQKSATGTATEMTTEATPSVR